MIEVNERLVYLGLAAICLGVIAYWCLLWWKSFWSQNARLRKALERLMDALDGCRFGCGSCPKQNNCNMGKSLCEANVVMGRDPCHTKYPQQD